ncbi:Protein GIS4 [Nakaseomyces bracarensis]|uniref:Protein GIS4 n=1 Tax=Nakaseomyces bracarensis TaxID=273131 RepID=A0ABR4NX42_9SACH
MSKSIKVRDYYNNDDNGVWSWYLANLRAGDFEELIGNQLKYTLLKRFLNKNLLSNTTIGGPVRFINKKLLFVSIPEDVHQNISILELFLRDYFHLQDLANIQISKLTDNKVYNHENHYFLMDELNNFEDPTFLELGRSNWKLEGAAGTVYNPNPSLKEQYGEDSIAAAMAINVDKLDSENSNTTEGTRHENNVDGEVRPTLSSHASSISCTSSLSSISSTGVDSLNEELRMQRTIDNHQPEDDKSIDGSITSKRGRTNYSEVVYKSRRETSETKELKENDNWDLNSNDIVNSKVTIDSGEPLKEGTFPDTASSIVLNFSPAHKRGAQNRRNKIGTMLSEKYPSDFFTPPQSEMVSINSYGSTDDYTGQPLKPMITNNSDDDEDDDIETKEEDIEQIEPICELSQNIGRQGSGNANSYLDNGENIETSSCQESGSIISTEPDSDACMDNMNDSGSDFTLMSILPSISIFDTLGYFRLVLQSIIIQDPESKEIFTAIRQSNNKPTIADITDDWLLYDSAFSMDNLQILSLQDIMDIKRDFPKILFYTMVVVNNRSEIACEYPQGHHAFTKAPTQQLPENEAHDEDREDNDHPAEVQEYFPNPQSITAEDLNNTENGNEGLHVAERTKSNMTTTHRSIRTVNSIGDWPLDVSGSATRTTTNTSYVYDNHDLTLKFDESSKNKMQRLRKDGSGGKYSKNYLTKVNTNGSNVPLDSVERTKSLPLPTLLKTLSNMDEQHSAESKSKWKFRSMKRNKKKSKSKDRSYNHKKDDSSCSIM